MLGKSTIAIRCSEDVEDPWQAEPGTIDVWWRGEKNGGLMLLLAHLLMQNLVWREHPLRLLRVIPAEEGRAEVLEHLSQLTQTARIEATTHVVVSDDPIVAIRNESRDAAIVFLGLGTPDEGQEGEYCQRVEQFVVDLPTVVFVGSAGDMSLES